METKYLKKIDLMNWETGKIKGFSGKDLVNLKNGALKMVKVDPFSIYPKHLHPDKTEFIFVLEGIPEITIGDEKFLGEKNAFYILPSNVNHSIENQTSEECLLLVGAIYN